MNILKINHNLLAGATWSDMLVIDIETDNSAGHGLNPNRGRVTEAAVAAPGEKVVFADEDEKKLLLGLSEFIRDQDPLILTDWNGSGFDMPFLRRRMQMHDITKQCGLTITLNPDLVPKYPSEHIAGCYDAVWAASGGYHAHEDVQWAYREVAIAIGVAQGMDAAAALKKYWSLKPMCTALGIPMVWEDRTKLHHLSAAQREAYVFSDVNGTGELAVRDQVDLDLVLAA